MENFRKTRRSFLKLCGFVVAVPISAAKALYSKETENPIADNWIGIDDSIAINDGERWIFAKIDSPLREIAETQLENWIEEWARAAGEEIDRKILEVYRKY